MDIISTKLQHLIKIAEEIEKQNKTLKEEIRALTTGQASDGHILVKRDYLEKLQNDIENLVEDSDSAQQKVEDAQALTEDASYYMQDVGNGCDTIAREIRQMLNSKGEE